MSLRGADITLADANPSSAAPPRRSPAPTRFGLLDDLRGIAALGVTLSHTVWLLPGPLPLFELIGPRVEVFFLISGFVMAYSLEKERNIDTRFVGRFMFLRSVRLDPAYWAVIGLELILLTVWWSEPLPPLRDILINAIYLQDLTRVDSIVFVAWTLCLELQFYLVLGVALALVQRLRFGLWASRALVFGPLLAASAYLAAYEVQNIPIPLVGAGGFFLPAWYTFFFGVALKWFLIDRASWLVAIVPPVALVALVMSGERPLLPYDNLSPLATAAVVGLLAWLGGRQVFEQGLGIAPIRYLGTISYSLYLIHIAVGTNVIYWVSDNHGTDPALMTATFLAALALSIGSAHLLYRLVEEPSVELARRLRRRQRETPAGAGAAAPTLG